MPCDRKPRSTQSKLLDFSLEILRPPGGISRFGLIEACVLHDWRLVVVELGRPLLAAGAAEPSSAELRAIGKLDRRQKTQRAPVAAPAHDPNQCASGTARCDPDGQTGSHYRADADAGD